MTPYLGKNFDPTYHLKKGLSKPAIHDAVPVPKPPKVKIPPSDPIPARIVMVTTGKVYDTYESRSAASKVLKRLIEGLPVGAPHTYHIEDDI
jgi:hypothetical protein